MNTDKIYAEHLANEYAPKDTSKVVALRKLDARAKLPATVFTYAFGIAAALVTGVGMCLSMEVIGSGTTASMALGIVIGLVGLVGMGVNMLSTKSCWQRGSRNTPRNSAIGQRNQRKIGHERGEEDLGQAAASAAMVLFCHCAGCVCRAHLPLRPEPRG